MLPREYDGGIKMFGFSDILGKPPSNLQNMKGVSQLVALLDHHVSDMLY